MTWARRLLLRSVGFSLTFAVGASASFAVPWQMQGNQIIAWLTDKEMALLDVTGALQLTPDSAGNGGYCYAPVK